VRAEIARELLKCIVDHRMAAKSLSAPERDAVSYLGFIFDLD
jgi:heat shock 70kDa protein 4